jgi:hypothetical protein
MFIPLNVKNTLVKSNIERMNIKSIDKKLPIGTISCRVIATGEILFQTTLESKTDDIFWNGEGTGLYNRFVPKVVLNFRGGSVYSLFINSKEIPIIGVTLTINV